MEMAQAMDGQAGKASCDLQNVSEKATLRRVIDSVKLPAGP